MRPLGTLGGAVPSLTVGLVTEPGESHLQGHLCTGGLVWGVGATCSVPPAQSPSFQEPQSAILCCVEVRHVVVLGYYLREP